MYCVGSRKVEFKITSDQSHNFPNSFNGKANFEDMNLKISIPVFSIHGSQDDPAGGGGLCALELLSMANLVNYFGKSDSVDEIDIYPILFEKGITRVALYGLGYIRDERLQGTFQERKVHYFEPQKNKGDWFSLFVLHQNRAQNEKKGFVHESMLSDFFDLILWGHEHECLVKPQRSRVGNFHICQPGSSIATSLCEGEAKQKSVGILEIFQNRFRLKIIPLQNVRPFVFESTEMKSLPDHHGGEASSSSVDHVTEYLVEKVEELILRASFQQANEGQEKYLPLVHLRVEHNGGISFPNPHRISAMFVGRVANPTEILLIKRKHQRNLRHQSSKNGSSENSEEGRLRLLPADLEEDEEEGSVERKIGDMIGLYIRNELLTQGDLRVHDQEELNHALSEFVDKMDTHSFDKCARKCIQDVSCCVEKSVQFDPTKPESSVIDILSVIHRKGSGVCQTTTTDGISIVAPEDDDGVTKKRKRESNHDDDAPKDESDDSALICPLSVAIESPLPPPSPEKKKRKQKKKTSKQSITHKRKREQQQLPLQLTTTTSLLGSKEETQQLQPDQEDAIDHSLGMRNRPKWGKRKR